MQIAGSVKNGLSFDAAELARKAFSQFRDALLLGSIAQLGIHLLGVQHARRVTGREVGLPDN